MRVAVLGLGYVGMTAAACMASQGHTVIGVDPNRTKVETVLVGRSPITEPGLDELVAAGVERGLLTAFTAIPDEVADCDIAIVCVGTPSAADGSHNMTFIVEVTRQLADLVRRQGSRPITVAYRSTIRPGSIEEIIAPIFIDALGEDADRIELVYNPEFLRESSAIADYFAPPKIVIGTRDGQPSENFERLNAGIEAQRFYVRYRESEITKFVDNTFHAVKTAFANEIGRICISQDVDPREVHRIFVSDTKLNISPYYLRPGGAFGGSCLPKDVRALQHISRTGGSDTSLIDSLLESNEAHKMFLFSHVTRDLDFGAKVVLLGLAFKDKSDDLRESPNVDLARMLITAGHQVSIFDPHVEPQNLLGQNLGVLSNSPFIRKMLIDQETLESHKWDLVVDTRSIADDFDVVARRVVDINALGQA